MNWGLFIVIFLFVISALGAIGFTLFVCGRVDNDDHFFGSVLCFVIGLGGGLLGLLALSQGKENKNNIEFPASRFRLELKITEFQGVRDTTFVLISKGEKK